MMRGWMAVIRRIHEPRRQISGYTKLRKLFHFFAAWSVLDWNDAAVDHFDRLKQAKIRGGTMDLKIAAIVLANDTTLLSRNKTDFDKVAGLSVEDWLS
jgi:tRNA(fMet)-specific endonuclease VapC